MEVFCLTGYYREAPAKPVRVRMGSRLLAPLNWHSHDVFFLNIAV